jgi:hypothetical protein
MTYEAAVAAMPEPLATRADDRLTDQQLAGPVNDGAFLTSCSVPASMKVTVKVAVKLGGAVGVTVFTRPPDDALASCVARALSKLSWPSNGHLDSFVATF